MAVTKSHLNVLNATHRERIDGAWSNSDSEIIAQSLHNSSVRFMKAVRRISLILHDVHF